jgi:hypothetical protein
MDDAEPVGVVERVEQIARHPDRVGDAELTTATKDIAERRPIDKLHGEKYEPVLLPGGEQAGNPGMIQAGDQLDLAEEAVGSDALEEFGVEDLERDLLSGPIIREEDPGVTAATDLTIHFVSITEGVAHEPEQLGSDGLRSGLGCHQGPSEDGDCRGAVANKTEGI